MKLADDAKSALAGNPFLIASPQTILVIGTDARTANTKEPGAETRQRCIDQGATGEVPHGGCPGFRADTLLLVRAGGGVFRKLSIPRDTFAEIPGQGAAEDQRRLRLRRRQTADPDGQAVPGDRR